MAQTRPATVEQNARTRRVRVNVILFLSWRLSSDRTTGAEARQKAVEIGERRQGRESTTGQQITRSLSCLWRLAAAVRTEGETNWLASGKEGTDWALFSLKFYNLQAARLWQKSWLFTWQKWPAKAASWTSYNTTHCDIDTGISALLSSSEISVMSKLLCHFTLENPKKSFSVATADRWGGQIYKLLMQNFRRILHTKYYHNRLIFGRVTRKSKYKKVDRFWDIVYSRPDAFGGTLMWTGVSESRGLTAEKYVKLDMPQLYDGRNVMAAKSGSQWANGS